MSTPNDGGTWLRWVVGILVTIIVLMAGAWANDMTGKINALTTTTQELKESVIRMEARLDKPLPAKKSR